MTTRVRLGVFLAAGLALVVALVLLVGPHASSQPDALDKAALDHGLTSSPTPRPADGSATAGLVGVVATFGLAGGLLLVVRRVAARPTTTVTE